MRSVVFIWSLCGKRLPGGEPTTARLISGGPSLIVRRLDDERVAFPAAARLAQPLLDLGRQRRAAVRRNDARFVDHLELEDHVARRLADREAAVVAVRHHRRRHAARDAAVPAVEVVGTVECDRLARQRPVALRERCAAFAFRRQRGQQPVRRIDDQIRLPLRNVGISQARHHRAAQVALLRELPARVDARAQRLHALRRIPRP